MQKAQSYSVRYGEHFCHCRSLCDRNPVRCTVSVIPHCSGRFVMSFLKRRVSSVCTLLLLYRFVTLFLKRAVSSVFYTVYTIPLCRQLGVDSKGISLNLGFKCISTLLLMMPVRIFSCRRAYAQELQGAKSDRISEGFS